VDFAGVDLTEVDLGGANLTDTRWPEDTPVPRAGTETALAD
jgi:hypothetical protein